MQRALVGLGIAAAIAFLAVSATANGLFLASLGRTPLEMFLLVAVSLASDAAKGVLPVIVTRCVMLRAWTQAALAGALLAATIALSLTSGFGFSAMTRSATMADRASMAAQLATRTARLAEVERDLSRMQARPASVIAVDLQAVAIDRRWTATKSCTELQGKDGRQFCAEVFRLRGEEALATERSERQRLRAELTAEVEALRARGVVATVDPQVMALAALSGLPDWVLRGGMSAMLVVVLELGSVVLLLLVTGPALHGWKEPGAAPAAPVEPAPVVPAQMPVQADRTHWARQQAKKALSNGARGDADAR